MKFRFVLVILLALFYSCSDKPELQEYKKANYRCGDYLASGELAYDYYSFCSIVHQEVKYAYKKGYWTYWNLSGKKIGEGNYSLEKVEITGEGACPYNKIENRIKQEEWTFNDEVSPDLRYQLETCSCVLNF